MPLTPGTRLGSYVIEAPLGAGGMGEVYRARDTKLNRDVAIKVLPDLFVRDPDRLARFEREAQTLATLNHPHIAQIYGVVEDPAALVMEFVDGEDLSHRLTRGPIPVDEVMPIARQIAEALEAAHERGIVHRDLKPANVKIGSDGAVKVLDFGLAKAVVGSGPDDSSAPRFGHAVANSPTFTSPAQMTQMGVVLGTAAYMAPEQAKGKAVDTRADIWAFGCVLFEMLAARRPFGGDDVTEVVASIVKDEPAWPVLPPETPPALLALLRRCLVKDPRHRLRDIGDARIALDHPVDPVPAASSRRAALGLVPAAGLALVALAIGALGAWLLLGRQPPSTAAPARLTLPVAPAEALVGSFALSADGHQFAFVGALRGKTQLFVRRFDRDEATPLATTDGTALVGPAFSPDGKWLAFNGNGMLKKVPVDGGPATVLAASGVSGSRPAWGPDDTIVFSNASRGLSRIAASGGDVQILSTPDLKASEIAHEMPWILPDGKTVLFDIRRTAPSANSGTVAIVSQSLETGERRRLFPGMVLGMIGDDQLIIGREESIVSVPFDVRRLVATGEPSVPLQGVVGTRRAIFSTTPQFSVARNGTMVFLPVRAGEDDSPMTLVERTGATRQIAAPPHRYSDPRMSPDGDRVVVHVFEEGRDNWIADLRRGSFMRLTFDPGEDETPIWAPDGASVFWSATREKVNRAIYRKAADGSGTEQLIWTGNAHVHLGGITPDGRTIVISMILPQQTDLATVDVATGVLTPLLTTPFTKNDPALSPDGKWLAYASDESGEIEVYVQPFPSMQGRTQVSAGGGSEPVWSRKGQELFYRGKGKVFSVEVSARNGLAATPPRPVLDDRYDNTQGNSHTSYDVTPDGRFLMIARPAVAEGPLTHLQILYRP